MDLEIFKFEKLSSCIEFCPQRGGLITSIRLNGKEILFLNKETFLDLEKNVRGGIPIMFPQAGPIKNDFKNEKIKDLKQHGFARNSAFQHEIGKNSFQMKLNSNDETKKLFDYDFSLEIIGEIFEKSIKITKKIKNIGNEIMPISPGFHPYFFIKNEEKYDVQINIENFGKINDYSFCKGETLNLKNSGKVKVNDLFNLEFSKNYNNIWIRSEDGKDFICIEPVYKNENALITNPLLLEPGEEVEFYIIMS